MFAVCVTRRARRLVCLGAALAVGGVLLVGGPLVGSARAALAPGGGRLSLRNADQNQARVEFLTGLGWQIDPEPVEVEDVVIPLEFDQVYENYNQLQQEQGFDLSAYAGRQVLRCTYRVLEHPSGQSEVRANLLVCGTRLIGGDVCSLQLDGFMHGLRLPEEYAAAA